MALQKEQKAAIVKEYGISTSDTGSTAVQVALLTHEINLLTDHCQKNPNDASSRRGLLKMVCRRRTFLDYLLRTDNQGYKSVIQRLGLRK